MFKTLVSITCLAVLATIGFLAVREAPRLEAEYIHAQAVEDFGDLGTGMSLEERQKKGCNAILRSPWLRLDSDYQEHLYFRCNDEVTAMIAAKYGVQNDAPAYNANERATLQRLIEGTNP
jgi:hypothetical protein